MPGLVGAYDPWHHHAGHQCQDAEDQGAVEWDITVHPGERAQQDQYCVVRDGQGQNCVDDEVHDVGARGCLDAGDERCGDGVGEYGYRWDEEPSPEVGEMRTGPLFSPVEAFSAVVRDNFRVPYRVPSDCVKWGYTWSGFFQSSVRCVGGRVLCKASSEVPSGRVKWGYIRSGCSQFAGQLSSRIGAGAGAPVLLVAL